MRGVLLSRKREAHGSKRLRLAPNGFSFPSHLKQDSDFLRCIERLTRKEDLAWKELVFVISESLDLKSGI